MLDQHPEFKGINLLGKLRGDPTDSKCIVNLSKTEFKLEHVEEMGKRGNQKDNHEEYFHNDIYRKYWLKMGGSLSDVNKIQCNLIYPATDFLIAKYSR